MHIMLNILIKIINCVNFKEYKDVVSLTFIWEAVVIPLDIKFRVDISNEIFC
jgi:hypothetical protein